MSSEIETLLFKQIEKPRHYLNTKAVNVYDNKYRINVYHEINEDNLTKRRMYSSYFAKLEGHKLTILLGPEKTTSI